MKRLKEDISFFLQNKIYVVLLVLTAVCCYGYKLMHVTVGIDDTCYDYYFSDGLIVVVGRWVLFLLNRFLNIGQLAPFLTDFAAVLLMLVAAVLWSVVCKRLFKDALPAWCYLVFSCLFISNPLICEVFTYFLHNGIAIGYTCSALGVLFFMEGLKTGAQKDTSVPVWKRFLPFGGAAVFVWIAIGCYESFAVVFLVMAMLVLLVGRLTGEKSHPVFSVLWIGAVLVVAILLRGIMTNLMIAVFSLESLQDEASKRSVMEMVSWITDPQGRGALIMAIKRAFVMYGVFGYHYLPIFMYVLACVCFAAYSLWRSVKGRDFWIFLYMIGTFVASWLLIFIEGSVTLYRSCQFLPLFSAFVFVIMFYGLRKCWCAPAGYVKRAAAGICVCLSFVAIWNQAADMNNWFYIDHQKYEHAKETMNGIATELETRYDTSKPLIFIGNYEIPMEIVQDAYVPIGSETYQKMERVLNLIDPQLLAKFYRRGQVEVATTPALSVIQWGLGAFDGNLELIKFMEMHGHTFKGVDHWAPIGEACVQYKDMPGWPREGSIVETEDYIIISFGY
ncbi:MAG: glucosyltransferase domain-containing protein [Lachnospiraceae bacterium]|nr:glucosyltransferase domain-containing protein [Lachnospiraceae bacterium]